MNGIGLLNKILKTGTKEEKASTGFFISLFVILAASFATIVMGMIAYLDFTVKGGWNAVIAPFFPSWMMWQLPQWTVYVQGALAVIFSLDFLVLTIGALMSAIMYSKKIK